MLSAHRFFKQITFVPPAPSANLYIISGPSGVGKTTIINRLLHEVPRLEKIVAFTSRKMRPGEIPGDAYHYISREAFENKIKNNEFFEYVEFNNNFYGFGLSRLQVFQKLNSGLDLIVDMDYSHISNMKAKIPHCMAIFITPSSLVELETRLTLRGDAPDIIVQRMRYAQDIIEHASICDKMVTNSTGKLESALTEIKSIIQKNREPCVLSVVKNTP